MGMGCTFSSPRLFPRRAHDHARRDHTINGYRRHAVSKRQPPTATPNRTENTVSEAWQHTSTKTPGSASNLRAPWSAPSVADRLRRLSERSLKALSLLPNQGRPSVGKDGMLREYRGVDTSDLPDPGHRHWSGLWALYPGLQVCDDGSGRRGQGRVYDPLQRFLLYDARRSMAMLGVDVI